jgi:hypothetical protein
MADSPAHLADRLSQEGQKTLDFFNQLPPGGWDQVIYPSDSAGSNPWQVRQVLAHFVSSEEANALVVEDIAIGGSGAPENFDVNRFNASQLTKLDSQSAEALLERFAFLRSKTVAFVRSLDELDLAREGRHPFFGTAPVEEIIKLIYRHNQIHQRDIRRALG